MKVRHLSVAFGLFLLVFSLAACAISPVTTASTSAQAVPTTSSSQVAAARSDNLMAGIQGAKWANSAPLPDATILQGINRFAAQLFLASAQNKGNVMVSPLSVFLALAMTANGAANATRDEMLQVLAGSGLSAEQLNAAARALLIRLAPSGKKTTLAIADSIWFDQSFDPDRTFLQTNADFFKAGATRLDFADAGAPGVINGWVNENTHGLITQMVDSLDPTQLMLLINTVYFKSDWQEPFEARITGKHTFWTPDGAIQTDFMNRGGAMIYFHELQSSGVVLPYDDGQFAYFALLPDQDVSPRDYLAGQNPVALLAAITECTASGNTKQVLLSLPKYEVRYEDKLNNELATLGMALPFDAGQADFSRMNGQHSLGLYIDQVIHKTYIRVDEKGTEAAAATAVIMAGSSAPDYDVTLVFDRPFIYGIIDVSSGLPLFVGILENPASQG
jgi:serine protease inhibitor